MCVPIRSLWWCILTLFNGLCDVVNCLLVMSRTFREVFVASIRYIGFLIDSLIIITEMILTIITLFISTFITSMILTTLNRVRIFFIDEKGFFDICYYPSSFSLFLFRFRLFSHTYTHFETTMVMLSFWKRITMWWRTFYTSPMYSQSKCSRTLSTSRREPFSYYLSGLLEIFVLRVLIYQHWLWPKLITVEWTFLIYGPSVARLLWQAYQITFWIVVYFSLLRTLTPWCSKPLLRDFFSIAHSVSLSMYMYIYVWMDVYVRTCACMLHNLHTMFWWSLFQVV